jgi:hypothetical protein
MPEDPYALFCREKDVWARAHGAICRQKGLVREALVTDCALVAFRLMCCYGWSLEC